MTKSKEAGKGFRAITADKNRYDESYMRTFPPRYQPELGEACNHPGCKSHISHPCEGCGRIAAGLGGDECRSVNELRCDESFERSHGTSCSCECHTPGPDRERCVISCCNAPTNGEKIWIAVEQVAKERAALTALKQDRVSREESDVDPI